MFRSIFFFEIKYQLKQPLFYGVTLFFLLMTFGAVTSDSVQVGGAIGNVNRNAPLVILRLLTVMSAIGVFVVTAFVASSAYRDFAHETHELFFSRPVRKFDYLIGRFTGSLVISFLVLIGAALGIVIGSFMPWLEPERLGPFVLTHYLYALFVVILPNLFFIGAAFFTLTALTRSMMATYMGVVIFFVIYMVSSFMMSDLGGEVLASLIDPFAISSVEQATKYWTIVERNTALPPLQGTLLYNRLLWVGIGFLVLVLGYSTFRFSKKTSSRRERRRLQAIDHVEDEAVITNGRSRYAGSEMVRAFSTGASFRQYLHMTKLETVSIFKSIPFLVILAFSIFNVIGGVVFTGRIFGTSVRPVTHIMLSALDRSYLFFLVIIITFYAGDLLWKERSLKLNEVCDSLPTPNWVFFTSKLTALILVVLVFTAVGMLTTMGYQIYRGYTNFEAGLYAKGFVVAVLSYCLICILASALQVVSNSKFVGYLLMIFYLVGQAVFGIMDFDHHLYQYAMSPEMRYSDMNGYGHFVQPFFWFNLYWIFFAIFLAGLCVLFWVRSSDNPWKDRMKLAGHRFHGPVRVVMAVGLIGFLATGSFIYYNTNILNEYVPADKKEKRQAEYEKKYRKYMDATLPRITDVKADVDIFPEERRVEIRGQYVLENKTSTPIDSLHVNISPDVVIDSLEFRQHVPVLEDDELGYYIYVLDTPLAPGASMTLDFDLTVENPGFVNNGSNTKVVYNGTFFNNMDFFPMLGYNESAQLIDRNTRRKYDLPPVQRMHRIDDEFARRNSYLTRDADWINFETTVSTSSDQIAIAPGYLQSEWREGDRRFFHYTMDSPILNFFSYLSADYTIRRDSWNDVNIEIYYHKPHHYNVDRMIDAVKKSLEYFTGNFGPYQHRQVRIVEFPRYAYFAQSFPNTIPYSEGVGFIAELRDEDDIDYVFYVTAHEVAHQWWGHQVIGANVQGATMLSETLAQYSALMVMEREYGREHMRKFLKYELDNYLRNRGGELVEEMPLMLVENQMYIHYRKGSVIMYALRDCLGEEALNGAIAMYRDAVAFQDPPYTTTREFMSYIREVTPDSMTYILEDMFETITLYSNRVEEATCTRREDGTYIVKLEVEAKKLRADGQGVETEIPLDDWIDIGIFGEGEVGGKEEEVVLYLKKHRIKENSQSFEIAVDEKPARAGIDPYNKLIDRNSDDNVKEVTVN